MRRSEALEIGYSYQAQKYHADHGNWLRVDRGIYRFPEWPAEPRDAYVRWSLWCGGRGVVSHESALAVHELSDVDPSRLHLTVDPAFHARDDAVVVHVAELDGDGDDVERRGAWSVTTPERTVVDAAGSELSQEHVDRAVTDALRLGRTSRRRFFRAADGAEPRAALRLERALATAEAEL